jgi:AraC-like DNA-binding protein
MTAVGADFDNHIVFIVNSAGRDLHREHVEQFAADINEKTSRSLGIRFSTTACRVPEGGAGLSGAYLKAVQASNYRFTKGPDVLLWADETFAREPDAYVYPIESEKRLCSALKEGRQAEAWQHYKAISAEASSRTYSVAQSVVLRLSLAVGTTIELMERGLGSKMHTDVGSFISRVSGLETMEEVDFAFNDVFRSVQERLDEARRNRNLLLVATMEGIIYREYRNPNLSLDLIADECKLSPSYAGRVFRKTTSKSVSEAINEKRLKVMAALLVEKDTPIKKIAEHVGIANSAYIYKLFKRAYGLTPNEYRRQELFAPAAGGPIGSG